MAAIEFAWVGAPSTSGVKVKARITGATATTLVVSLASDLSSPSHFSGSSVADDVWSFTATGLTAGTVYYWTVKGDTDQWSETGTFTTFPSGDAEFVVALASCAGHLTNSNDYPGSTDNVSNAPTFLAIRDAAPLFFMHMGDMHYRDISTDTVSLYRQAYRDVLAEDRQQALYKAVPIVYAWDDHDFGPDGSNGDFVGKPAARQAFGEYVPHYPLGPADGTIGQSFAAGGIRFIILDIRSERSDQSDTDDSSKTMLGSTQKTWFKAELLAATEDVIVVNVGVSWTEPETAGSDYWGGYSTERQELAEFFEDNDLTAKLFLVHGDRHYIAADDGTNSQFDPAATSPGPPVACFAAMDAGISPSTGGEWTHGPVGHRQAFGTLEITRVGAQVRVEAKGWRVLSDDPDAPTKVALMTLVKFFGPPTAAPRLYAGSDQGRIYAGSDFATAIV